MGEKGDATVSVGRQRQMWIRCRPMSHALGQAGRRITDMDRHGQRTTVCDGIARGIERTVNGIALRGTGAIDDRLGDREIALGRTHPLIGLSLIHIPSPRDS